jgi:hypothetical protein
LSQVLDRDAQAVARGAARCASQVLDRGARAGGAVTPIAFDKVGSAAMLPQQEKNNSADVQRGGFIPRGDVPGRRRRMFEP